MSKQFGSADPLPLAWPISANDPDRPPDVKTPWDDEFDGPLLDSKWTIFQDASGNYTISFSKSLCNIAVTTAASSTNRYVVLRQDAPAGNWRVRAKFLMAPGYDFSGSHLTPIVISSGKWVLNGVFHHSVAGHRLVCGTGRFTNSTYAGSGDAQFQFIGSNAYYQELEYDGTNVIFRISIDGIFFTEFYREATATFLAAAPTGIMVGLHPYNNVNNVYKPSVAIDWFRRMA